MMMSEHMAHAYVNRLHNVDLQCSQNIQRLLLCFRFDGQSRKQKLTDSAQFLFALTGRLHDVIEGKGHERNPLKFTLYPAFHQARKLMRVLVVSQVRVPARPAVDDPGPLPSRQVQGGAVQIHSQVSPAALVGRMCKEQPGLRVWRLERQGTSFVFSSTVWCTLRSREADDTPLAARRRLNKLRSDVGFVKVDPAVFTQGLAPVPPHAASIAVKMTPALVVYDLRHFALA